MALSLTPALCLLSQNWPTSKKSFVTLLICIMTFGVYSGSAIYTPGIPGIMVHFDTSLTMATLGLTLFVIGEQEFGLASCCRLLD